jgi:hypothetical protein
MSTTCKYYKQKKQVSYDNGQTWQDVSPAEYQRGDLYETRSRDCGYSEMYKYVKVGEECENGDLYKLDEQFVSYDGGETWVSTGVINHTVIERDSDQCKETPEPEGCKKFIVDGGQWDDAPATGASTCDSAFLYDEGQWVITPATAASWVTISKYHWDTDDESTMCSNYRTYPCVANNLMYDAGLVNEEIDCSVQDLNSYPKIVKDAVNKTGPYAHALGTVRYTLSDNTGPTRSCTINWLIDDERCPSNEFTITQLGTGEQCPCDNFNVTTTYPTVSNAVSDTEYTVGHYTAATDCTASVHMGKLNNGSDFLGSFRFDNGTIYAKVKTQNTSYSSRVAQYTIEQNNCKGYVNASQQAAPIPPATNKFQWAWEGHESSYSTAITSTELSVKLVPFESYVNGVKTNATIQANVPWIVTNSPTYVNNNELRPDYEEMVGVQKNTGSANRTGTLTLRQKGTSNTISMTITQPPYTPDCTIKSFTIGDEVCKGESLSYSYQTVDTSCSGEFTFRLWDSAGSMITSNSTPSGGSGSGSFNTSTAALGGATVDVTVNAEAKRYNINVIDCATPVEDITVTFTLTNKTGSGMYFDRIRVMGTNLYLSVGSQYLNNNQSRTCAVTLGGNVAGTAFTGIQVADTLNARREYRTNSTGGTLTDGATITANITEMI